MGASILQAVPNVSEGRDVAVVDAIGEAYVRAGATLAAVHRDVDHHRSVHVLFAPADIAVEALLAGIEVAARLIDLRTQDGVHPRIGAADVFPLVGLDRAGVAAARGAALDLGERVGRELGLPVFLYGAVGEGRRPAFFRRGGPAVLQRRIDAGELRPDFGPQRLDPRVGGVLIGARPPLIAFNLTLENADLVTARAVAAVVRESGGGMPGLQAIGIELGSTGEIQVSMNVIDVERASLHDVVALVEAEAAARGATLARGELVGLLPAAAIVGAAEAAGVEQPRSGDGSPTPAALAAAAAAFRLDELDERHVVEHYLSAWPCPDGAAERPA